MSCCSTVIDLGCVSACDLFDTGLDAVASGVHKVEFDWLGVRNRVNISFTSGDDIEIPGFVFNEASKTVFRIVKPDGTYQELSDTECFQVETLPGSDSNISIPAVTGCTLQTVEFEPTSGSTVTLASEPTTVYIVYYNGIALHTDNWSLTGTTLTLNYTFEDGDIVAVLYC